MCASVPWIKTKFGNLMAGNWTRCSRTGRPVRTRTGRNWKPCSASSVTAILFYCHSMDRLARNLDDLRKLVLGLTQRGVQVCFVKESLTFTGEDSPMSNLLLSVMGAFAQFERELIRERQREGIAIAKRAGKYRGRETSADRRTRRGVARACGDR